jgi:hypothetical protein
MDLLGVVESCAFENYFATLFFIQLKKDCTRIKKGYDAGSLQPFGASHVHT